MKTIMNLDFSQLWKGKFENKKNYEFGFHTQLWNLRIKKIKEKIVDFIHNYEKRIIKIEENHLIFSSTF